MWLIIHGTPCHPEYPDSIVRVPPSHQKGCSHNFTYYDKCIGLLKGTLTDQAAPASKLGTGVVGGERVSPPAEILVGLASGRCRFFSGSRNGKHHSPWGCSSAGTSRLSYWDKRILLWWLKGQMLQDMLQHQVGPIVLYLAGRKIDQSNLSMKASLAISS